MAAFAARTFAACALLLLCLVTARPAQAAPTSIVYTGQLLTSTSPPTPANGTYDFQFQLFNAATGGTQVGPTVSLASVPVVDGVYQVQLSFGNVFTGQTLWLQVSYRVHPASGSPAYTTLSPRQVAPNSAFADYATLSGSTQGLQTKAVSAAYPTTGQVLTYNGTLWAPATPSSGGGSYTAGPGLSLSGNQFSVAVPLALTGSSSGSILSAANGGGGTGVYGTNTNSGDYGFLGGVVPNFGEPAGVFGSDVGDGVGVYGVNLATGTSGFLAGSDPLRGDPVGVYGSDTSSSGGSGVYGTSANGGGVYGVSQSTGDYGVLGLFEPQSGETFGVFGEDTGDGEYAGFGVYGTSTGSGTGVVGTSNGGFGVYGSSSNGGTAGYFNGNVVITGTTGNAASASRIDHPVDPAHKYLSHASVQSDRMEDVYHGHVILDANGAATVQMPAWFQSLNGDFEYTLTCIGAFAPVYIAQKMQNNQFGVAGGKPGMEISWQVTGVRHDAFALAHPLQVEQDKPEAEQGLYQNPEAFGLGEDKGTGYAQRQAHRRPAPPAQP